MTDATNVYADAYLELLLISNMRLYDVMLVLLSETVQDGEHKANLLRTQHMQGQYYYPPFANDPGADAPA